MSKIKLVQDNNWNNKHNKKGLEIDVNTLEYELKLFFEWKTPTKKYNTFRERFSKLGSTDHDKFINHLINSKGY